MPRHRPRPGLTMSFFQRLMAESTAAGRSSPVPCSSRSRSTALTMPGLVVGVVDGEAGIDADGGSIAAQHTSAEGVERAHGDLAALVADEGEDALPHLGGSLVGEGHGQDLPWLHAFDADQVGDAVGQHAGLARAGASQDEQGALGGGHRARLLGVQPLDDGRGQLLRLLLAPLLVRGARAPAEPGPTHPRWRPPSRTTHRRRGALARGSLRAGWVPPPRPRRPHRPRAVAGRRRTTAEAPAHGARRSHRTQGLGGRAGAADPPARHPSDPARTLILGPWAEGIRNDRGARPRSSVRRVSRGPECGPLRA